MTADFLPLDPLSSADPTRPALEELAWILFELANADQIFVYRGSEPDGLLDPAVALGALSLSEKQIFWSSPLDPSTDLLADKLREDRQPIVIANDFLRQRYSASILSNLRTSSFLILPLSNSEQLLGVVIFAWLKTDYQLPVAQEQLATAVARSMALALDNARLYEVTSRQLHQVLSLQKITQAILQKADLLEVLRLIAQEAVRLMDAFGCCIRLLNASRHLEVVYQTGRGLPSPLDPQSPRAWVLQEALQHREPVLINLDHSSNEEGNALLIIPLAANDEVVGFLEIHQRQAYFQPRDIAIARSFASQAAMAIEHVRLYQRVQQTAVVEERARLARDLHDSISQALYAVTLYTRAAQRQLSAGNIAAVNEHLGELDHTARGALGEMRLLIFELRPPALDKLGLQGALDHRLKSVESRSGLSVQFNARLSLPISKTSEETLYRIAQESLNNIIKHAQASRVEVELTQSGAATRLLIRDDGLGFDPHATESGGLGLKNMAERASALGGQFSIDTRPGGGVTIFVEVPNDSHSHSGSG